jgi:2-polyprenyl-3-methyl-5-hydroxy-6-metoxy-1,4-benzoquinol methylase
MRSAEYIEPDSPEEEHVRGFDLREIDSRPPSFWTRQYLPRLERVMEIIRQQVPRHSLILDGACAQGNLAILAAEAGYRTVGLDLVPGFLNYAKKKDDGDRVSGWVVGNALTPPFKPRSFDAVVLGEIIEHVAEPVELIKAAASLLRRNGVMVCTTPNAACFRHGNLPSYRETRVDIEELKSRQFGPAGKDHLFAVFPEEVGDLAVSRLELSTILCTSALWNRYLGLMARSRLIASIVEQISCARLWQRWLCQHLILVFRA